MEESQLPSETTGVIRHSSLFNVVKEQFLTGVCVRTDSCEAKHTFRNC